MLYVDFTRAVDRLHIISPLPKKVSEKNCHTWLHDFALLQPFFNNEFQYVEFGVLSKKNNTHAKQGLEQLKIEQLEFHQNKDVIKIKSASSYNSHEEVVKAREYGILVHYILSKIKTHDDLNEVVQNSVRCGDITNEEANKLIIDIKRLLSINMVSPYFHPSVDVKNEMEILTSSGEILRPDRWLLRLMRQL